jgi:GNAT superfamily N-acetyltransferase
MSDGPHRSLPMRKGWKRVAESADNQAFGTDEIRDAILPALEEDCRGEIGPEFFSSLRRVCTDQEASLFKNDVASSLEALRNAAGAGLARAVLNYALQQAARRGSAKDIPESALKDALIDRAARGARQVEEHYCRESTMPRANRVRERIEQAIGSADIGGVARRILDPEAKSETQAPRRKGLDDGVKL